MRTALVAMVAIALDGAAEPAVLWAASETKMVRCEDQGAKFTDPAPADCFPARFFYRPTADPTRRLVASKTVTGYSADLHIMEEETGQTRAFHGREIAGAGTELGRSHRLGPDGSIYGQDDAIPIRRHDRDGKPKPFAATLNHPKLRGYLPVGPTGTTSWERDFWVDRKNDIYVRASGPEYHGLTTVQVFNQSGEFKRTVLWTVSDGTYGPRVDTKGNLYIMEAVKPQGQPFPTEFADKVKGQPATGGHDWICGSVVKFGPGFSKTIETKPHSDFAEYTFDMAGEKEWKEDIHNIGLIPTNGVKGIFSIDWVRLGKAESKMVWRFGAEDAPDRKLPATMPKEQVGAFNRPGGAVLQGALWWKPGFSPVGDIGVINSCHCAASDFDVDNFGRVFAPDTGRFRVGVLDTNGNEIQRIGRYGNADSRGPGSPVPEPEIAFAAPRCVAVADNKIYVSDPINQRIVVIRLDYVAEETCEVKP